MNTYLGLLKDEGRIGRMSDYRFGHGELYRDLRPALLCSYHPSQQNTSTGKLTQPMLDEVFLLARSIIQSAPDDAAPHP
jgi:uracil-DNA glycosylase